MNHEIGKANCAKKRFYRTRKAAKRDAKCLHRKFSEKLYVYDCPYCDFFHLTKIKQE